MTPILHTLVLPMSTIDCERFRVIRQLLLSKIMILRLERKSRLIPTQEHLNPDFIDFGSEKWFRVVRWDPGLGAPGSELSVIFPLT